MRDFDGDQSSINADMAEDIDKRKQEYLNPPSGYHAVPDSFIDENGGFILLHDLHNLSDGELLIAETFANEGSLVKLLPERSRKGTLPVDAPRPDAEIDGAIWDFKLFRTTNQLTIQRELRKAKKQASNVAFLIGADLDIFNLTEAIKATVRNDFKNELLQLRAVLRDKSIVNLSREEIKDGTGIQKLRSHYQSRFGK
jgi:hypothetical protein